MVELDHVVEEVLKVINDNGFSQKGAFNLRQNGTSICHGDSEHIKIKKKTDKPGIDIYIDGDTKGEKVYIPVVVSVSGMTDLVYNDFYIADGADVTIVAGCGIHNCGDQASEHDGIHTFYIEKDSKVRYIEKHYGEGDGKGDRILNPTTVVHIAEGGYMEMETVQIKGVSSTVRTTEADLSDGASLVI
ncbi:SufD family Fe-S cluster assembly protein, partial [butyrate-producing bacterium]|nr:SufD family Fe-S cluster assembly protein [butyrate-producing bacterium]